MGLLSSIPLSVRRRIPGRLRTAFNRLPFRRRIYPPPILDIWPAATPPLKRALVSYITAPFKLSAHDPRNIQFSNIGIVRNIARALNELGYAVDVVEWSDSSFVPRRKYDVFVGHCGCNFETIAQALPSDTTKIYFSTGLYWREWNRLEEVRLDELQQRRGVRLAPDRKIEYSEESANRMANGIICLGNHAAKESYRQFPLVINLNNAAYHDARYDTAVKDFKDFAAGRKNFLFFSGPGNVHKGLDLLLEAFGHEALREADVHLYICQSIAADFHQVYEEELTFLPRVHVIGPVAMRSRRFYELADRCDYVVHPTCAEGQPGSVIECMHQGLIPILSRQANMDTRDFGVTLDECSIAEIVAAIRQAAERPVEQCEELSRKARAATLQDYSEAAFLKNMKAAISTIESMSAGKSAERRTSNPA